MILDRSFTTSPCPVHLVSPKVVNQKHAGQVQHHAQSLEGGQGEPKTAVLLHQTGGVVLAERAALPARQALVGRLRGLISVGALFPVWGSEDTLIVSFKSKWLYSNTLMRLDGGSLLDLHILSHLRANIL